MPNTISLLEKPFKLSRPTLPARSILSEPDRYAKDAIDVLDAALGGDIWPTLPPDHDGKYTNSSSSSSAAVAQKTGDAPPKAARANRAPWKGALKDLLEKDLQDLVKEKPSARKGTLEMLLARDGQTSLLFDVEARLGQRNLSYNAATLLKREALFRFLFADAVYRLRLEDPAAIASYIRDEDEGGGIRRLYEYVVVSAVQAFVDREKIEVDDRNRFLRAIGPEIKNGAYSFQPGVFEASIKRPVFSYAFDRDTLELVKDVTDNLGLTISPTERDFLVRYFGKSNIKLTPKTAEHLVPIALTQQRNASLNFLTADSAVSAAADFSVSYHTEDHDALAINRNNVLCGAQLFYVMTLGDELGVFTAIDLLVTKYLGTGVIDVQSPQLLQDLQNYVLNDEFSDLKSGRSYKRTSAEERRMFYRQVFNYGDSGLMDGMISNTDFEQLWNVLMIETVKYIEKMEQSEQPELFVSRNTIAQAIEDLQYNLSTHCSGMAKVLAPVMYKELDFSIERIFKSSEIVTQLALHNSKSYWKVIERILHEHYQQGVNITAYQNKAIYGHQILEAVANYTPLMIDDDQAFSSFVSLVEAFIITSEQLEARSSNLFDQEEPQPVPVGGNGYNVSDDWDF